MIEYEYLNTTSLGIFFKFIIILVGMIGLVTSTAYSYYTLKKSVDGKDKKIATMISKINLIVGIFLIVITVTLNNDLNNINVKRLEFTVNDIKEVSNNNMIPFSKTDNSDYLIKSEENLRGFDIYASKKYVEYHGIKKGDEFYLESSEELRLVNSKKIYLSRLFNIKKEE